MSPSRLELKPLLRQMLSRVQTLLSKLEMKPLREDAAEGADTAIEAGAEAAVAFAWTLELKPLELLLLGA